MCRRWIAPFWVLKVLTLHSLQLFRICISRILTLGLYFFDFCFHSKYKVSLVSNLTHFLLKTKLSSEMYDKLWVIFISFYFNFILFHFNFQGVPLFLEDGRYSDLSNLSMPENVGSVKYIELDFGTPELHLNSSTNFKGSKFQSISFVTLDWNQSISCQVS